MKPIFLTILSTGLFLPGILLAEVISQDSFSAYTVGMKLPGQNPTINGYLGAWTDIAFGNAEPAVLAGSLIYPGVGYTAGSGEKIGKAADTAGIAADNCGRAERLLDSNLVVTDATTGTIYLSWLFQTGNENAAANANTYQTLALWNGTAANDGLRDFEAGIAAGDFATTNYGFRVDNNSPANLNIAPDSNVHLMVAKFVLSDAGLSDSVTVWIDPVLGAGEPTGGVTVSGKNIAFDRLVFSDYASNSSNWDEVRWGTTFDNVTVDPIFPSIPEFELQPLGYVGLYGDSVTLQSGAVSSPAPTYQWEKSADGVNGWSEVDGEEAASLQIPSANPIDSGFYRVIATNPNGSTISDVVELSFFYPYPVILQQPESFSVQQGSSVQFSVNATSYGNLEYQWHDDEGPIPGAILATLELTNVQEGDEGSYWVRVIDNSPTAEGMPPNSVDSDSALLSVFPVWSGLVSHDAFDAAAGYVTGALATQSPAIAGYTDAWVITNGFGPISPVVSSGSLLYPDPLYLGASGNRVDTPADAAAIGATNAGRVGRLLAPELAVNSATTGTRYVSWLFRSGFENTAPDPQVYQTLALFNGALGTDANRDFEAGIASGDFASTNYSFRLNNNPAMIGNLGVPADGNVHLFVAKIELSSAVGGDSVTVWIDPALGSGEPAGGVTVTGADLLWDRVALSDYASNSSAWDEIRWGSTFHSVTLNGNPANDFAAWIASYNVGSLNGFDDDADGDGIKNGLENFFGTHPALSNQGITQVARTGSNLTFQHPQSATAASDVTVSYRWSTNLAAFHASGAASGGTTVTITPALNTPSTGTTSVTASVTGTTPTKLFLVLEAVKTP
ncbi:MAG: immunoglobulin domain-containing protein [Verrucomicrobiota bacterium]